MAKDKVADFGEIGRLAEIADSVQKMFTGKSLIVFELKKSEYSRVISHFREIDRHHKQFSIDISGTEFIFILDENEEN
jgi:hypothetical protein